MLALVRAHARTLSHSCSGVRRGLVRMRQGRLSNLAERERDEALLLPPHQSAVPLRLCNRYRVPVQV